MGSCQRAGYSGRQDLEGRIITIECPLVGSKGDALMVYHGLIASANNISKVNFRSWLLPAK